MNDHFDFDSAAPTSAPDNVKVVREEEFVANLLKRQDEVLGLLDDLNSRIEQAILEIGASRQQANESQNPDDAGDLEQQVSRAA